MALGWGEQSWAGEKRSGQERDGLDLAGMDRAGHSGELTPSDTSNCPAESQLLCSVH